MLDLVHPWGRPLAPPLSSRILVQAASEPWEIAAYHELRRKVFVVEQGLFELTDLDRHDSQATHIVALSQIAGMADEVVGVVRIYPAESGVWHGGRLAVSRRYRRAGMVGSALIIAAVSTARAQGCRRFLATVQLPNASYFERHHFQSLEVVAVCGRPHLLMEADLSSFPANAVRGESGQIQTV